ncbi:MAG TPA: hypothetical protein VGM66_11560 [Candidatus Udaeobacter sp.]|jgi:hypothetical protein
MTAWEYFLCIAPFVTIIPLVLAIRRYRRKPTGWHTVLVVAATSLVIASPFLILFGVLAAGDIEERRQRVAFDSAVWKASLSTQDDPIRLRMVDDLLRQYRLRGMRQDELIALLGEPPKTDYFSDYQIVYWLGPERGFISIDSEWLAIWIGPDQRVTDARIVRD